VLAATRDGMLLSRPRQREKTPDWTSPNVHKHPLTLVLPNVRGGESGHRNRAKTLRAGRGQCFLGVGVARSPTGLENKKDVGDGAMGFEPPLVAFEGVDHAERLR